MPMHNWTKVDPAIFHAFHHLWISALSDLFNSGNLPPEYYALPEQVATRSGPDSSRHDSKWSGSSLDNEIAIEFYRRKKSSVVVRHVSDDRLVAVLEIVTPGNKSTSDGFRAFVERACELLEHRVHLLLIDPFPPTKLDPNGIHVELWSKVVDQPIQLPDEKPLTLVSYECGIERSAYIDPIGIGDSLPDMPLFLEPSSYVMVPLESTYTTAFSAMPKRWRSVLEKEDT